MWEYTDEALQHIGDLFVAELKKKIKQKSYPYGNPDVKGEGNKYASGDLYNSISANVIQTKDGATLEISYNDYFKYVNKGRKKGRGLVPIKAILKWISIRGIKGRNKKGRFIKNISFAFAIQKNIFKYGIRPANIYDNTLDTLEETFNNLPNNFPPYLMEGYRELYEAIGQDANLFIEATLEKELNTI
jgi:hypothetical protein